MPTPDPRKKSAPRAEAVFQSPPLWMHESVASLLGPRREARKRAILRLLDRVPLKAKNRL